MTVNKSFGQQLRAEREKLGLTTQDVANKCGVTRSYLTLIENGRRLPGKNVLPKIAAAIGLTNTVLINWYLDDIRTKVSS